MLGISKGLLNDYIKRGRFPEPVQRLAATPIWTLAQIERFKESRRKP